VVGSESTLAQMKQAATFVSWGCEAVWTIDGGNDTPRLVWENATGTLITNLPAYGGSGTSNNPYLISNGNDLQDLSLTTCHWDNHFQLTADLDLTGVAMTPIGTRAKPFSGTFDGNGHTIVNLTIDLPGASYVGLFGFADNAVDPDTIFNLGLINPNVTGNVIVGALAGSLRNGGLSGCYTDGGSVSGNTSIGGSVGGLVGGNSAYESAFLNHTFNSVPFNLRDISTTGTFISLSDDETSNAIPIPFTFNFYGTDFSQLYVSSNGFVTFFLGKGSEYYGHAIPNPSNPNGFIAGYLVDLDPPEGGTLRYQTLGTVGSREFVIGFYDIQHWPSGNPVTFEIVLHEDTNDIELQYGSAPSNGDTHSVGIENFDGTDGLQIAFGDVSFANEGFLIMVDGEVNIVDGGVSDSYSTTMVTGNDYVGGLVGSNDGTISKSYATGMVDGDDRVGGLVGWNRDGTISDSTASGTVTGTGLNVGGLVGQNSVFINYSYATGTVSGGSVVGGLVGWNTSNGTISDSYSAGAVTGSSYVGSLVGYFSGTISNCYARGAVSGTTDVGGLVGLDDSGIYTKSFWNTTFNSPPLTGIGNGSDPNVIGVDDPNMQIAATFTDAGWDFVGESANGTDDIWDICEGTNYPKLSWQEPVVGDWVCPDGVFVEDLSVVADEWLLSLLEYDLAPPGRDGLVNWQDFAELQNSAWATGPPYDVAGFADQWLKIGTVYNDLAPNGGDGFFNLYDFSALAANWMAEI